MITGASGFVGRHLTRALAAAYPTANVLTPDIDMRNPSAIAAAVQGMLPEVCVHLAAVSAVAAAGQVPDRAWQVNCHGTMHLGWALAQHVPNCQLLFVSSADAYGASFKSGVKLDESAPLAPINVYAETKATADLAFCGMAQQGLRVVRLRPFNHTGPGQSPAFVVPALARQIARIEAGLQSPVLEVGALDTWRDFLDVRDVCAAYVACIAKRDVLPPGQILNLASGQPRRIGDVVADLAALAGVPLEIHVDRTRIRNSEIRVACGNAARAEKLLDWRPVIPWVKTLQDVLADWRRRVDGGTA